MAKKAPVRRVRRTAEDARAAILDATERHLLEHGPAGLRIAEIAADVGVSHPAVLHHFGSREALVAAVVDRSVSSLHAELVEAIARTQPGGDELEGMLERSAVVLSERGYARIAAWVLLSGYPADPRSAENLESVAKAAHEIRKQRHAEGGRKPPRLEDTRNVVRLAALALFGDAIVGPLVRGDAGAAESKRFRAWLAGLLRERLERGEG